MTQNAKKPEQQNPMAIWWKTLDQAQQMMQDNTLKTISGAFETQRKMMRALFKTTEE